MQTWTMSQAFNFCFYTFFPVKQTVFNVFTFIKKRKKKQKKKKQCLINYLLKKILLAARHSKQKVGETSDVCAGL